MNNVLFMYEAVKVKSAEIIGVDLPSRSAPVDISPILIKDFWPRAASTPRGFFIKQKCYLIRRMKRDEKI